MFVPNYAMRFCLVLLFMIIACLSCSGNYSKNETIIKNSVIKKEADKGKAIKDFTITGHKENKDFIDVFIKATDASGKKFTDTLRYNITGDGFIIQ